MSNNLLEVPFWKVALRFTLVFLVVIAIIMTLVQFMQYENLDAISESFEDGSWVQYVINKLVFAVIYGAAMAFFSRRRERKNLR
ncbi:hypothetical protein [Flavicella sediminum]|uniref:hypothetical protein n=1 Tax=Flavicella sediminum TaxID=2585141 RepID=UPI00111D128A|nr:hypothetical protein [Flavicella sediminum]